jgi:hypothetical protein
MNLARETLHDLIYSNRGWGRFTQDSPVMPDVWFGFGSAPDKPLDLLLEPFKGVSPGRLAEVVRLRLQAMKPRGRRAPARIAYDESYVVVRLSLPDLICVLLPLTLWWQRYTGPLGSLTKKDLLALLAAPTGTEGAHPKGQRPVITEHGTWFLRLAGTILAAGAKRRSTRGRTSIGNEEIANALAPLLARTRSTSETQPSVWSINRNREAHAAVWDSRKTVKADAATQIFNLDCGHLTWAILDTGIDARHPAFRVRDAQGGLRTLESETFEGDTRVRATYDFTRIRDFLQGGDEEPLEAVGGAAEMRRRLHTGQSIDWELLEPLLRVPHDGRYVTPGHPHGTHVAGILGADWRLTDSGFEADDENDIRGLCPNIRLLDLRVLDATGRGDEFAVMAALQFVRFLNARSHSPRVHGTNLSLSIPHDVSNYACGRTPVCNEAERLQASGVIVVAAAGNEGYVHYLTKRGESSAYRNISITDPGNAEAILTVGATHGRHPHSYGVSYFSSRGPTGDGRRKPDLVAPGEKIKAPAPGESYERADGTSMAAPHVSGAAALLISRHAEFIGEPARVKQILISTATDLGRERHFQGAGLVDVLRAIQSI